MQRLLRGYGETRRCDTQVVIAMKLSPFAIASLFALTSLLHAQGASAVLADGRVLTPVQPLKIFLTEGPITSVLPGSQTIQAQGLNVTIPASVDGTAFEIPGTNFAGAPITAATMHALLDENAAPGGRDATSPLQRGAVRSIYSSARLRLLNAQDAPHQLAARTHLGHIRNEIATRHVAPVLATEGVAVPGQTDQLLPDRFEYSGGTLKSAGHIYQDAQGNQFLIPDLEMAIEIAENIVSGPVTSVTTAGDYPSFVVGEMPVVLNPDPRFPVGIQGLGGVSLSPQTFFGILATTQLANVSELVAEGYVVDGVLFALHIDCLFSDPLLLPNPTIDRAQFDNARNEIRLRGIVDKPLGLSMRVELRNGAGTTVATFTPTIVIDPLLGGAGEYSLRQRGGITGGLARVASVHILLTDAAGTVVNQRSWLRSEL